MHEAIHVSNSSHPMGCSLGAKPAVSRATCPPRAVESSFSVCPSLRESWRKTHHHLPFAKGFAICFAQLLFQQRWQLAKSSPTNQARIVTAHLEAILKRAGSSRPATCGRNGVLVLCVVNLPQRATGFLFQSLNRLGLFSGEAPPFPPRVVPCCLTTQPRMSRHHCHNHTQAGNFIHAT